MIRVDQRVSLVSARISSPVRSAFEGAFGGRRVFVTGHTGFKGSWLCAWLLEMGAEPIGYALDPPTDPSLFETIGLAGRMEHHVADVRDAAAVAAAVEAARADLIVHMAAQALVRRSYAAPVETFETNILGTVNVLEAVRRIGRPCAVIVVTSDKCYEPAAVPRLHAEDDALGGFDPYSASKGGAEVVTAAYRRSFFPPQRHAEHGVALASVRAGNVIGGGDWAPDRIVPDIVRALSAGRAVGVRHPEAVRPWHHVLDALSGYLRLGAHMLAGGGADLSGSWNFGPEAGSGISVRALAERVLQAWGQGRWEDLSEPGAPPESPFLGLCIDKAKRHLQWRPVLSLQEAIDATVAWYRSAARGADMYAFTAGQIAEYADRAGAANAVWTRGVSG
jgi:CDP-glucose 4,6-dehydratase